MKRTVIEDRNGWIALMKAEDRALGITGYYYVHEMRAQDGEKVAVLAYRVGAGGLREYLVRSEIVPCWGPERVMCALTGTVEIGDTALPTAVKELHEEAGYVVDPQEFITLGAFRVDKMTDSLFILFAVDVTGMTPGEAIGDGSEGEAHGTTVWLTESEYDEHVQDVLSLALRDRVSRVRPAVDSWRSV